LIFVSAKVDDCGDVEGPSVGKNGFPASVVLRQTVGGCWWWVTEMGQNLKT
jgi:hypothetical protein